MLPGTGTISYNGFSFSAYASSEIRFEPMPNDGATTHKARRMVLTVIDWVEGNITGNPDADNGNKVKRALTQPGKRLSYTGRGFEDIIIDGTGGDATYIELKRGPWPRIVSWKPIGADRVGLLVWELEAVIAPCDDENLREDGLMAYEYGMSFSRDEHLVTTVEYKGYIEVSQPVKVGDLATLAKSADDYRHLITMPLLDNFKRMSQHFSLSPAKDRIEFTIVDREMTDPLPDGMTSASATYAISQSRLGADKVDVLISATYNLAPGVTREKAMQAFKLLLQSKAIAVHRQGSMVALNTNYKASEDLYGRVVTFAAQWLVLPREPRGKVPPWYWSGMWMEDSQSKGAENSERIDAGDANWRASLPDMASPVFGPQVRHVSGRDAVVSYCMSQTPGYPSLSTGSYYDAPVTEEMLGQEAPVILHAKENISEAMDWKTAANPPAYGSYASVGANGEFDSNAALFGNNSELSALLVATSPAMTYLNYAGIIVTTFLPHPIPRLVSIDGNNAQPIGTTFQKVEPMTPIGGTPIYKVTWDHSYWVPRPIVSVEKADVVTTDGARPASENREVKKTQSSSAFQGNVPVAQGNG